MNTISNNGYKRMHFLINKAKIWIQNFFKFLGNIYLIPLSSLKLRLSLVSWLCDRDVLRGIGYLHHVKKRCHGNFSETNIVIVNGRAKVTGMVNDISKTSLDDYSDHLHLAIIIRRSFGTKQLAIPTELELFITYISTEKPSRYASKLYTHTHTHTDFKISHLFFLLFWSRLLNIENHPIFLSPLQRLSYRVIAHTILYFGKSKKSFVLALNKKLGKCKWKHNVKKFHMVLNRYKTLRNLSSKQRKIFQYKQSAISYMRFCRNVVVHLKDNNFNRDVSPQTLLRTKFSKRIKLFFKKILF